MNLLQRYSKLKKYKQVPDLTGDKYLEHLDYIIKASTPIKDKDYFDGKDGYSPIKGIDYFDGKNGKDGYTPVKGKDYFDGKDGKNGKDGLDGKSATVSITPRLVRDKLESLEGDARLDASAIKNLPTGVIITATTGSSEGGTTDISGLLKIDGSNHMTTKLGIGTAPRVGSVFDVVSSVNGGISDVASGSITFNYSSGAYYNEGLSFEFKVYAYRVFGVTRVYSVNPYTITGTDNSNSDGYYNITLDWSDVVGADGYRIVVVNDSYAGAYNDQYFDVEGSFATIGLANPGYVEEVSAYYAYSASPTVTPNTTPAGADFYIDTIGDLHSTRNFYFNNFPSVTLGNNNGLSLTGISTKVLSLPTTAKLHLSGLSFNSGVDARTSQLVFPQGAGGSSAPGIRFVGGQTDGGLAMNDGILEFWNNFSQYVDSPVAGHLQAVFRIDTRSGYEVEGFTVGGSSPSGVGAAAIGVDFNYFDVNLCYYGHGSVGVGADTNPFGIRGTDGNLGVKYDLHMGRDIVVSSINGSTGMKIGTDPTQKIGWWDATPVVQSTGWSVTNVSADKTFDASNTSLSEVANVLGTLIEDIKTYGLLGS